MPFIKYQHVERFGTVEVEDIELGECYVFPKIDGTNGCVWFEDNEVQYASRKRHLVGDLENQGFKDSLSKDNRLVDFFKEFPKYILYGEWLVPHSLKIYREDAWRKFYIFDVCYIDKGKDELIYLSYDVYSEMLEKYCLEFIPPITKVINGTLDRFIEQTKKNNFLIEDGNGVGEGIVIKRYGYKNKYGRTAWAKIVTSEFKEKHVRGMGCPTILEKECVEEKIARKYCTEALIEKVYDKVRLENNGFSSKQIPQLLNTVYYDIVKEDCWNFIKENKNPTIDFKRLYKLITIRIKEVKNNLF